MATKVSVSALGTADKEGWLIKQGGKIKTWKKRWFVLKGDTLYYFKTQKDAEQTGEIKLLSTSSCNPEPGQSKKGKYRFSIGTPNRVYMIVDETEKGMQQWVDVISKTIDRISNGGSSNNTTAGTEPKKTEVPEKKETETPKEQPAQTTTVSNVGSIQLDKKESEEDHSPRDDMASGGGSNGLPDYEKLTAAKEAIPFLNNEDSKVLEFWTIWADSIPDASDMEGVSEKLEFQLSVSAAIQKLTWRAAGPQNAFIQKMVDFFWNVGAPESEIDKLNDVGALINPTKIGSWIDMSEKGGMDGGWYFPVSNTIKLALAASDPGDPTTVVEEWATKHNVKQSYSVGRDMGAAPPRQTEIFLQLPGDDVDTQISIALDAFSAFQFPPIPDGATKIMKEKSNAGICLSIITSAEGFVRLGILVPKPSRDCVDALCSIVDASADNIHRLESSIQSSGPAFVEYQHLTEGFGYGVYNEGFDVVFHYSLN